MTNYFLSLIVIGALVGTFASAPAPEPPSRSLASRTATSDPVVASHAVAGSSALDAHQPPIPFVRNGGALPTTAISPDAAMPDAEVQAREDLDSGAAQAAIEGDGYKGVSGLGRGIDGAWHAKAYRGTTEVRVTVDGSGRVSVE
jgi:hypothetical protein